MVITCSFVINEFCILYVISFVHTYERKEVDLTADSNTLFDEADVAGNCVPQLVGE